MEKILTIYDWWDGPLCGLATYKESICIYERIFDKDTDEWSDEYYLTPIDENTVDLLLKDWDIWCEKIRNKDFLNSYSFEHSNIYHNAIESSVQKRVYKRMPVFYGDFDKGFIPIDYSVEWTDKYFHLFRKLLAIALYGDCNQSLPYQRLTYIVWNKDKAKIIVSYPFKDKNFLLYLIEIE